MPLGLSSRSKINLLPENSDITGRAHLADAYFLAIHILCWRISPLHALREQSRAGKNACPTSRQNC